MNYKEALQYIETIQMDLGSDLSLDAIRELAKRADHPERKLRVIHIAGTNGKGSVGNFICNILAASGYAVGRYISPTLFEYRERIQRITGTIYGISREYVTEEEVAENLTYLERIIENMQQEGRESPTAFEIETVMAYRIMASWNVDVAVVEVGMGGRLDATNIIEKPVLSVITPISMDHTDYLGDTLVEIAAEKYGIIKPKVPVVSIRQEEHCMELLRTICKKQSAKLTIVEKDEIRPYHFSLYCTTFFFKGEKYELRQPGVYQLENAAIAVEAAKVLFHSGFRMISGQSVLDGIEHSHWKGRFEVVSAEPLVIVDGAHNTGAALQLKYSLEAYFPHEKFTMIIGMFRDKDHVGVLSQILPFAKSVYTIQPPGERGLSAEDLAQKIRKIRPELKENIAAQSVRSAISSAIADENHGKIVIFGSLSFLHEVYEYFGV